MSHADKRPSAGIASDGCNSPKCCGGFDRRWFLKAIGLSSAVIAAGTPAMAGPFETADFEKLVPADKKLSAEWIESLFARGRRTVYRGNELEKIGMPIGGICTGQLYLGGDGRLWRWDIFNQQVKTGAGHYAKPPEPDFPIEQGFAIQVTADGKMTDWPLSAAGFSDISFTGEYPMGYVEYRDAKCPVLVSLEAFSPFIPLDPDDSHLPAVAMQFTVRNTSIAKVECRLAGWMENGVCLYSGKAGAGKRLNNLTVRSDRLFDLSDPLQVFLNCSAEAAPPGEKKPRRPDIVFDDFRKETYEGWDVTGTVFGRGPVLKSQIPAYQGDVGSKVVRVVNSHASAPGKTVAERDRQTGTLTSKPFTIERDYINFWIGGGNHPGQTCINLRVDGKVVLSATGHNNNQMRQESFDVRDLAGKTARLEIVDNATGPWGNIGIAEIVFTDGLAGPEKKLEEQEDFGTMGLGLLPGDDESVVAVVTDPSLTGLRSVVPPRNAATFISGECDFPDKPRGAVGRKLSLEPGKETTVTFILAWHFPNIQHLKLKDIEGRKYGKRFKSAEAVALYVADNFDRLAAQTRLWHDTWYNSTLSYWFLDRTFLNTSILATSTAYWFGNSRFYGWEGVGCCAGTCTHVWHYAHAAARLFPQLERSAREMVDFGEAFDPETGAIGFRGGFRAKPAIDGQAGCILRAYREHQMSPDDAFLRRNWPNVKKALQFLIAQDANGDGILEGSQHNTLDADWYGPIAWLSGLYLAALRAGEEMAREMNDDAFARQARAIVDTGSRKLVERLFNGQYFINRPDPRHPEAINSGTGCEIDQVFGQSWAFQVGLGRILPVSQTLSALRALWRYNFTPDVGPYREASQQGRWYAMPGEAGLLMCTFPRNDWDFQKASGSGRQKSFAGYFNECMTGFEYQVAGHMIWEGMVQEGLAIVRAIHDRYHASRRNPWNEVECGDHYARAMASYGVFLAACGYEYHGPKGHLGFAPRLTPHDFRAAFTAAEGWGSFQQKRDGQSQHEKIELKWGELRIKTLAFQVDEKLKPTKVTVTFNGQEIPASHTLQDGRLLITLGQQATVSAGQTVEVAIRGEG